MNKADYALLIYPMLRVMSECGDCGKIFDDGDKCFLAMIDVLGHGSEARQVGIIAEEYLEKNHHNDLFTIMNGLHTQLMGTRGAVAALCIIDNNSGRIQYTAVGNITVRIFGHRNIRLVSRDGIVGYGNIRPVVQEAELVPGDTILLHTDGIREHFDELECAGLFKECAEVITKEIMSRFARGNDDAACIAYKYLK
ncbi:MAG: SpoIIE family protein phosphatase [Velocimicrobium sp.]